MLRISDRKTWPGTPYPLGATVRDGGVNFALFSQHARAVDLCLFDAPDAVREERIRLSETTQHVWHCFVPGLGPGQAYGYRVHGLHQPLLGSRFNSQKLLLDPYARAIAGELGEGEEIFGYPLLGGEDRDLKRDLRNDAWLVPKSIVIDDHFDWGDVRPPRTPLAASIIYETHVKGFTMLAPGQEAPGTYAAMGSAASVDYLRRLGVTAVELLPVQQFLNEPSLASRGLANYWGYNTIGYFAPHAGYSSAGSSGGQVVEFKQMVKNLHAAGIEVLLDVVYNHTAEGNHFGPTLCFRGIDNAAYYRLEPGQPRFYRDYSGCGNTLNTQHPRVLQLIVDSLRYWVTEMQVDGFRFDLASALARERDEVDLGGGFLDILQQDPVLSRVKLIAEPWDLGPGGYLVGGFPVNWAEWNGKYRDGVRSYWRGDAGHTGEFASRLTGSSDLYKAGGRRPDASINFITAHDGFTLADLVAYNEKHNLANGEENRDGESHNRSWNSGAEGVTDDPEINALRRRRQRNFLTTLLLSQGVPMFCAGDEYGRSQGGNNNAYCQDNQLSWLRWSREPEELVLEEFTRRLIRLRREHPIFRRPKYFHGQKVRRAKVKDLRWFNDCGDEMSSSDWNSPHVRALGAVLAGVAAEIRDERGELVRDDTFMLLSNAHHGPVSFTLPALESGCWELFLDTQDEQGFLESPRELAFGSELELAGYSMGVLRLVGAVAPM